MTLLPKSVVNRAWEFKAVLRCRAFDRFDVSPRLALLPVRALEGWRNGGSDDNREDGF
jgi:hypothetical protein